MDTMTPPSFPTIDFPPPPPPPAPKKTHKGLIIVGVLVVLGIIGAVGNAHDEAKFKADLKTNVDHSLTNNVTSSGGLNETGYVRDGCAGLLDMDLPNTSQTAREGLASGAVTVADLTESFAGGYYDKDGGAGSGLTRSLIADVTSASGTGRGAAGSHVPIASGGLRSAMPTSPRRSAGRWSTTDRSNPTTTWQ
jgi:hypothetical protein